MPEDTLSATKEIVPLGAMESSSPLRRPYLLMPSRMCSGRVWANPEDNQDGASNRGTSPWSWPSRYW
jgi:hypothetical protein